MQPTSRRAPEGADMVAVAWHEGKWALLSSAPRTWTPEDRFHWMLKNMVLPATTAMPRAVNQSLYDPHDHTEKIFLLIDMSPDALVEVVRAIVINRRQVGNGELILPDLDDLVAMLKSVPIFHPTVETVTWTQTEQNVKWIERRTPPPSPRGPTPPESPSSAN